MIKLNEKEQKAREMVCLPLDGLNTLDDIESRVKELSPVVGLFKIGKESYTRFGPEAVGLVQNYGAKVFLDLKYFDIPNTVKGAADAATRLGVYMFNVHALGGLGMMKAAVEGARTGAEKYERHVPKIVAVTILTSIDQKTLNEQLRIPGTVEEQVLSLAKLANEAELDGIVCSAADLYAIKNELPKDFMYVTPGIQGISTSAGEDQKRVFSPGNAVVDGSSILVVGRAITNPETPEGRINAGYEILKDMAQYL
ncbi:MAG: orotidine-5'-phosphate decarboxylase [Candidatus Nanoarchaeia archaeon]|nr:orotidine-5'-phosphate decarboxylase [Candidatus Nanoarchaeia archaeon]